MQQPSTATDRDRFAELGGVDAPFANRPTAATTSVRTPSGHIARRGRPTPVQRRFANDWHRAMQYWRAMGNITD